MDKEYICCFCNTKIEDIDKECHIGLNKCHIGLNTGEKLPAHLKCFKKYLEENLPKIN